MIPQGSLLEFSLSDVLQIVSMEEATGTLELSAPGRSGTIEAQRGSITAAVCGPKLGDDAVYALFLWEDGQFIWTPNSTGRIQGPVELPLGDLSREGIHRRDLWRMAREVLPSLNAVFRRKPGAEPAADWTPANLGAWNALDVGLTVGDLGRRLQVSPAVAAQALLAPWQAGALEAEFPASELSWLLFGRLMGDLVSRFADISGLKMTEALAGFLSERARSRGLDVQIRAGKFIPGEPPQEDPTPGCREMLAEVSEYASRLHGVEFIDRLYSDHVRTAQASELPALERLGVAGRAAAGQAAGD